VAIYVDDKELVAAHQAGDEEAFEELVREYRPALFAHGRRKLYCDAAAEDAVQEALVRAFRALPKFNGEYRLGPWLHRIMANVCVDELNRRQREGEKIQKITSQPVSEFDALGVEEELGLHLDSSNVSQALDELPESYSEALKLRFIEELEYDQLAQRTGVSEQNARARVSRARVVMRAALKGVASVPVLLFGILRRGEKAAAAATSTAGAAATSVGATTSSAAGQMASSAVPALSEAAVALGQTAPAVVPTIAKAAMAVGITAAILTPTTDSAVHQAVNEVMNAPVAVEAMMENGERELAENALVRAEEAVGAVQLAASGDGVSISRTDRVATEGTENAVSASEKPPAVADDVLLGSITAASLPIQVEGANRFSFQGQVELLFSGQVISAQLGSDSWLRIEQAVEVGEPRRLDGLLPMTATDGTVHELRLAGFATFTDSVYEIDGLFRLVDPSGAVQRGHMVGHVTMTSGSESAVMEISLRP